jgi:hypothetical protein
MSDGGFDFGFRMFDFGCGEFGFDFGFRMFDFGCSISDVEDLDVAHSVPSFPL